MLRRVFLGMATEELLASGKIRYHSKEHQILREVATNGAWLLNREDRTVFDTKLVPMIEKISRKEPTPLIRAAANS